MIKKVTKERVERFEENDIICDLCEKTVAEGTPMITLTPQIAERDGNRFTGSHRIEVCSVECLTKNAAAAGLLMNTNIFPAVRTEKKKRDAERNQHNDFNKDEMYKQMAGGYISKKTQNDWFNDSIKSGFGK